MTTQQTRYITTLGFYLEILPPEAPVVTRRWLKETETHERAARHPKRETLVDPAAPEASLTRLQAPHSRVLLAPLRGLQAPLPRVLSAPLSGLQLLFSPGSGLLSAGSSGSSFRVLPAPLPGLQASLPRAPAAPLPGLQASPPRAPGSSPRAPLISSGSRTLA